MVYCMLVSMKKFIFTIFVFFYLLQNRRSNARAIMKHESQHPELISSGKGKPFKKSLSLGALGLGKLWRRRSVTITEYDPCYKVVYLGNVLTGIAKGMYRIIIITIFERFRLRAFWWVRHLSTSYRLRLPRLTRLQSNYNVCLTWLGIVNCL